MATIKMLTLCPVCAKTLESGYRLSRVQTETTTEKKGRCEYCRAKFPADVLQQFTVTARRR